MPRPRPLSPEQQAEARRLLADGATWGELARHFGYSYSGLRRQLDPEFRASMNASARNVEANKLTGRPPGRPPATGHQSAAPFEPSGVRVMDGQMPRNPLYDPRRDGIQQPRDLTAVLMGDPPVGRS